MATTKKAKKEVPFAKKVQLLKAKENEMWKAAKVQRLDFIDIGEKPSVFARLGLALLKACDARMKVRYFDMSGNSTTK